MRRGIALEGVSEDCGKAGDRTRTGDHLLGRQTDYVGKSCADNELRIQPTHSAAKPCVTSPKTPPENADLAAVVTAWPTLPADVRKMIVGVVKLTPKAKATAGGDAGEGRR